MEGREQAFFLEPECVQDLVVPEQVTARPASLGNDRVGQADGLGALDVELGEETDARGLVIGIQNRLGKLAIEGRVDHDRVGRDQLAGPAE